MLSIDRARCNLAGLNVSRGRYDEAEPLFLECLEAMRRVLGPEHPQTQQSVFALAKLLHELGRDDEALPLAQEALSKSAAGSAEHSEREALVLAIEEDSKPR